MIESLNIYRECEHMIEVGAELAKQCKQFGNYLGIELCFYCEREDDCEEATDDNDDD